MKATDFQKLLFKAAITTTAVDGEIHQDEISEIKNIAESTAYFLDFDYEEILEQTVFEVKSKGKAYINQFLTELKTIELSEKQELKLIEVLLRVIEADKVIENNEVEFLQLVKSRLKTSDETLISLFPNQIEHLIKDNRGLAYRLFEPDINIKK